MKIHCSDRKKRSAKVWQLAVILHNLLSIDLSQYPKGNVIIKRSRQWRTLSDGKDHLYKYSYAVLDIFGVGQIHLPTKNKERYQKANDDRWKLRDQIVYRNDIELRIEIGKKRVENAIRALNSYKSSKEVPETFESVMESVRRAMLNKGGYEEEKRRTIKRLSSPYSNPVFDIDGMIVTDLGEEVRSKNECIFANKLHEMGVPYLYEMEVGNVGKPDFTVFIGEKVYFIELFGMMEQEKYERAQTEKVKKYSAVNICMGKNLLLIDVTEGINCLILEKLVLDLIVGMVPDRIVRGYSAKKYDKTG